MKGKLPNEVESFTLAEDHLLFWFKMAERDSILHGGPWVVAGQLLAMEPWVLDFKSGTNPIKMTMVYMHLPELPIEFRSTCRLLSIVEDTGSRITIDDFTEQLKKIGFARVRVEIDSSLPLKPRVLIKGKNSMFWQGFVY